MPFFTRHLLFLFPFLSAGVLFWFLFRLFFRSKLENHKFCLTAVSAFYPQKSFSSGSCAEGTACEFGPGIDLLKEIFAVTWGMGLTLLPRFHPALLGGAISFMRWVAC